MSDQIETTDGGDSNDGHIPLLLPLNHERIQSISSSTDRTGTLLPVNLDEIAKLCISELDDDQRKVAEAPMGISIYCVAGPGSGKTRTLEAKFLLTGCRRKTFQGQAVFTFTRNACEEVKSRIVSRVGQNICRISTISTIHSFVLDLVNQERRKKKKNMYSIITNDDLQEKIYLNLFSGVKTNEKTELCRYLTYFEEDLVSLFERISVDIHLNNGQDINEVSRKFYNFVRKMFRLYDTSDTVCIDFHSLMIEFHQKKYLYYETLKKFTDTYYDEVQDMDDVQQLFVEDVSLVSQATESHFGDPDQRVFSCLKLSSNFDVLARTKHYRVMELTRNYRNPKTVILARKAVKEKRVVLEKPEDEDLDDSLYYCIVRTFPELVDAVYRYIQQQKDGGNILVLARTNSPLNPISVLLEKKNVPHELWSDTNHKRSPVVLSSIHRAKGCEASFVVIINFVRYEFPYVYFKNPRRSVEEAKEYDHNEFCVLNVGLSRTQEECLLMQVVDMTKSPSFFFRNTKSPGASPYFKYIKGYCQNLDLSEKENKLIEELGRLEPVEL